MGRMERARRAAGPSATPRVRLARQRRRAPPLPGERAVRTARGRARSPLQRAVLFSTVTLVAYACCVAAGNVDRRDG